MFMRITNITPWILTKVAFRNFRPHYIYFHELRPPVSSRYFYFLHCFCTASTHWAYSQFPHACWTVFRL